MSLLLALVALGGGAGASEAITEPDWLRWGATQAQVEADARRRCTSYRIREIRPPFLTHVRAQTQLDCEGLRFWGGARRAEFVIGDDSLEMVWIMIERAELGAAERAMRAAYGENDGRREDIIGFAGHRTALRSRLAEVLFYSPRQSAEWRLWYTQSAQ